MLYHHLVNYENIIFDEKIAIWKVRHDVLNIERTFRYLKIQDSLPSENVTEYYLCIKKYFEIFSLSRDIFDQHKIKEVIELVTTLDYYCLKAISEWRFFVEW